MSKKKKVNAVEIAQKQRHLYLLSKIQGNQKLSKSELKELGEFESLMSAENGNSNGKNKKGRKAENNHVFAQKDILPTQKAAAEFAGVSVRTIQKWKAAGMPCVEGGGYFKGILEFYKENQGHQPTEERRAGLAADADYKAIRAKLLQMELDVKQGKLVPIEEIERGRITRILTVKRALLGLGRKLAPQLAKLKDTRKINNIINAEARSIIKGFSGE